MVLGFVYKHVIYEVDEVTLSASGLWSKEFGERDDSARLSKRMETDGSTQQLHEVCVRPPETHQYATLFPAFQDIAVTNPSSTPRQTGRKQLSNLSHRILFLNCDEIIHIPRRPRMHSRATLDCPPIRRRATLLHQHLYLLRGPCSQR